MGQKRSLLHQIGKITGSTVDSVEAFRSLYPDLSKRFPRLGLGELSQILKLLEEGKAIKEIAPPIPPPVNPREQTDRNKEIRELYATGEHSYRDLSVQFNISRERVRQIVNGEQ